MILTKILKYIILILKVKFSKINFKMIKSVAFLVNILIYLQTGLKI